MAISKVLPTEYNINTTKISILGPKSWSIGGHDIDHPIRQIIRQKIDKFLDTLITDNKVIIGLTGLSLGVEQDFAIALIAKNIDYKVYLPYLDQENYWENLPKCVHEKYAELLKKAINVVNLFDGHYSPKKNVNKKHKIIKESDIIIFVTMKNTHSSYEDTINKAELSNKIVYNIYV